LNRQANRASKSVLCPFSVSCLTIRREKGVRPQYMFRGFLFGI